MESGQKILGKKGIYWQRLVTSIFGNLKSKNLRFCGFILDSFYIRYLFLLINNQWYCMKQTKY